MSYELRPLSFGEILDQAFKLLRDHFRVLIAITGCFYVPYSLITALSRTANAGSGGEFGAILVGLVSSLVMGAVAPLVQLATMSAVSDAYLRAPSTVGGAYRIALKAYVPYMGTSLLMILALTGLVLLLFVPAIYFGVSWSLIGPLMIVEHTAGRAALKRSRALTKGHWWRTLGVVFVPLFVISFAQIGLSTVLGAIPFLGGALIGAVQATTAAYTSVVLIVLYVDLRCRKEDFDLQMLASQVAAGGATSARAQMDAAGA